MYYYSKNRDCFYSEESLAATDENREELIQFSEEEYAELWNCDKFHYVAQDPITMMPRKMEKTTGCKNVLLRRQRERDCFPIINRGQLWYNHLTDTQKLELDNWYCAWLNVTETLTVPNKPSWL